MEYYSTEWIKILFEFERWLGIMTKKEYKRRLMKRRIAVVLACVIVLSLLFGGIYIVLKEVKKSSTAFLKDDSLYLSLNGVTRTGEKSPLVGIIAVENSGFDNLTAIELRNRYERADILNPLMQDPIEKSAHYVVGIDGVSIEIIPLTEKGPGGEDHIVIAYSHDENGEIPEAEQKAINDLLKDLCDEYSIAQDNIIYR